MRSGFGMARSSKYIKKYEMMIIFKKGSFDQEDTHELLDSVAYWADVVFLLYRCWCIVLMVLTIMGLDDDFVSV